MIVDLGISEIITDMSDLLDYGVVSSDSTSPAAADTSISAITGSESVSDINTSNATITFKTFIDSGTANSTSIYKAGVYTTNSTLFSEDVHPEIEKTASDEITYFYKLTLQRG